jgi:7SK snRNA methylphosphate capping enzyme
VPVTDQDGLEQGTFDTIICFSVTKWIHLNGGDEALQALLARVHSLLAPNGRFILEPQQWVSYRKAVKKPVSTFFRMQPSGNV